MTTDLELLSKKARRQAALAEAGLLPRHPAEEVLIRVEYTLLTPVLDEAILSHACALARENTLTSLCVPSPWIGRAAAFLRESAVEPACFMDFPFGGAALEVKKIEALSASAEGAQEIQIPFPLHRLKKNDKSGLRRELETLRSVLHQSKLTLVIETALLSDEEIINAVRAGELARADRVKGGSGFWGATTLRGAAILRCAAPDWMGVTAVLDEGAAKNALPLLAAGADRLSTSSPESFPAFTGAVAGKERI